MRARRMQSERWWWLAGFLLLSILIHLFLALHGPGFGLKGEAPSPAAMELTLEPLPPVKPPPAVKPKAPPRPKTAKAPAPPVARHRAAPPAPRLARAVTRPTPPAPVKRVSTAPRVRPAPAPIKAALPALPDETPDAAALARPDTPKIARTDAAPTGLAGGASGGGRRAAQGVDTPLDQPPDSGLAGGMHFPRMAARVGGESVMSVKNPLAEDAVPEEKPGFSEGAGGRPGLGQGRGSGGLNGKLLAGLRGGRGPGLGGGLGGGRGAGSGRGAGRGRGLGRGTGAGASGLGDDDGLGLPAALGSGAGGTGLGVGTGTGRRVAGGGAFGAVGGLLRGEPARTPGDGRPGTGGHGLSAEIYEGRPYLEKRIGHRTDAAIDFNWGETAAVVPGASRIFSVRWTGKLQPKYSEVYTFDSEEDDGLRLWVDGQPVITDWEDHKLTAQRGSLRLEAGRKYDIKVEYFNGPKHMKDGLGHAEVHLRWSSRSQPLEVVPESALFQAG